MALNGTHNGATTDQLVGRVLSVNERGFRLEGREGWLNISKWAESAALPERGIRVAVTLDGQGFVRAVAPAEPTQAQGGPSAGRDTTITRLAVLKKAAAAFCASRPELKSSDLLALAERMEAWVLRSPPRSARQQTGSLGR